jgi:hypothetical protein
VAHRPFTIALSSAALATAVVAAGTGAAFAQSGPTETSGQPNVVRPGVEVVAGTLSPETFQASINEANGKIEAMRAAVVAKWQADAARAAMNAAVVANWVAQAQAAEAEAQRIAYEQSVAAAAAESMRAAAYSAPAQSYSAPAEQSYSAPAQSYSAPAEQTYSSGAASGDASSWASSSAAQAVKQCESGGNYSTNTGNGYYGAWQFDASSWLANGGGAYAPTADQAPAWAQDQVAYNYYSVAGWGPWACAQ